MNEIGTMENKAKAYCYSNFFRNDTIRLKVVGIINSIAFQKARICAEKLYQHLTFKFATPQIIEMFQVDWYEYILERKRKVGGKMWSLKRTVAVFIDDKFLGSDDELLRYISESYIFSLPVGMEYYENLAMEQCKLFMEKSKRKYVYFTFTVNGCTIGSFMFMLYSDLLPLTCQYFLNLCTGYDAVTKCYKQSYYINMCVHRIVKNGWIQCGSKLKCENTTPIYDTITIPGESYCIPHNRRGVLSLINDGKHCNGSQFFVCLKPNPWMNYYYVAFGQLVDGAKTLETLENISTYYERPSKEIIISDCGEYLFGDEPKMEIESKIFLKHEPSLYVEGEDVKYIDGGFDFYSIISWLDNIVDKIDLRDTASVLMAERYLNGFYCLSSDYMTHMDMHIYEEIHLIPKRSYESTTEAMLRRLLLQFHPSEMGTEEKSMFISEISKIILAYIFCYKDNKFCLKHISTSTREIIHKILEIAHEISLKAVGKIEIAQKCNDLDIANIIQTKQIETGLLISENCISLLQVILNESILYLMRSSAVQEQ
ncbi:putative inactive peptidyl-prolyl cis-trans isomerase-like 6 [Nomia melanderi]|uniref:putative inactive peptidyl-prolyl cis-trans isomerase-like 6 n=1 Tax=Nomia melanderi TaxID=2448451 RepID=UPI003FCC8C04